MTSQKSIAGALAVAAWMASSGVHAGVLQAYPGAGLVTSALTAVSVSKARHQAAAHAAEAAAAAKSATKPASTSASGAPDPIEVATRTQRSVQAAMNRSQAVGQSCKRQANDGLIAPTPMAQIKCMLAGVRPTAASSGVAK